MTEKSHVYRGMTSHQCCEWRMFVSRKCKYKYKPTPLGIEPISPASQAGILATILWWNQINCSHQLSFKYNILYSILSTIDLPSSIATLLRSSRYLYCAPVGSILVRRDWFGNCTICFVLLLVIQKWYSRW